MRVLPCLLIIIAAPCFTGCADEVQTRCVSPEKPAIHDVLYFGAAKPNGSVTAEEWASFLTDVVTPRFPRGLTVLPATGQWRTIAGKLAVENSWILDLVHAPGSAGERAAREIVAAYKSRFHQEAVLRVTGTTCASFD